MVTRHVRGGWAAAAALAAAVTGGCNGLIGSGPVDAAREHEHRQGLRYYLPKDVVVVTATVTTRHTVAADPDGTGVLARTVVTTEASAEVRSVPDARQFYVLDLRPSGLRQQTLAIGVGEDGLLNSAAFNSVDKAGETITNVGKAVASVAGTLAGTTLGIPRAPAAAGDLSDAQLDALKANLARIRNASLPYSMLSKAATGVTDALDARAAARAARAAHARAYARRLPPVARWFAEGVDAAGRPVDPRGPVLLELLVDAEDALAAAEQSLRAVGASLAVATDEAKQKAAAAALAAAKEAYGLVLAARDRARAEFDAGLLAFTTARGIGTVEQARKVVRVIDVERLPTDADAAAAGLLGVPVPPLDLPAIAAGLSDAVRKLREPARAVPAPDPLLAKVADLEKAGQAVLAADAGVAAARRASAAAARAADAARAAAARADERLRAATGEKRRDAAALAEAEAAAAQADAAKADAEAAETNAATALRSAETAAGTKRAEFDTAAGTVRTAAPADESGAPVKARVDDVAAALTLARARTAAWGDYQGRIDALAAAKGGTLADAAEFLRETRVLVTAQDVANPSSAGATDKPGLFASRVYFRPTVPVRFRTYTTVPDAPPSTAVHLRPLDERIEPVARGATPAAYVEYAETAFTDRNIGLTFSRGRLVKLDQGSSAGVAAFAAAASGAVDASRTAYKGAVTDVKEIEKAKQEIAANRLQSAVDLLAKQKQIVDNQVALQGAQANSPLALEQSRLAAELTLLQAQLNLGKQTATYDADLTAARVNADVAVLKAQVNALIETINLLTQQKLLDEKRK